MPNVAQIVYPTGQSIAPESLAPLPADWREKLYTPVVIADPDDPDVAIFGYALLTAGGEPVTGTGWGFNWGNDWGGGS
jgi:hypothetical protein